MRHSDIVYRLNMDGAPAFVYLLPEHQSTPVPDMAFRMLKYLMHAAATDTLLDAFRRNGPILGRLWHSLATRDSLSYLETIIRYAVSVADIDAAALQEIVVAHVNKEAADLPSSGFNLGGPETWRPGNVGRCVLYVTTRHNVERKGIWA